MLNDLKELISIKSVNGPALPNAPFGAECRQALDWFLAKAESYGLSTGELDGYCGWAEYGNSGDIIGILCHTDVVPAGEGWTDDPFNMVIADGKVYGRGVADDKGPLVASLHVLKRLKDENVKLNHRIRLIVGCNEEQGSACIKHYKKYGEIPAFNIVPDADFPVINSEKGIMHLNVTIPANDLLKNGVTVFKAGNAPNIVPNAAALQIAKDSPIYNRLLELSKTGVIDASVFSSPAIVKECISYPCSPSDFSIYNTDNGIELNAKGIAGHAMAPVLAENAISKLFCILSALLPDSNIKNLCKLLSARDLASGLKIATADKATGELTTNLGIIELTDSELKFVLDIRLPISAKKDNVIDTLKSVLPSGASINIRHHAENLYYAEDSDFVKALCNIYQKCTGDMTSKPVQTGGGTYARELPNSLAFGPTFPDEVTNIHNADECIKIEHLDKLIDIYYEAVLSLDKLSKV